MIGNWRLSQEGIVTSHRSFVVCDHWLKITEHIEYKLISFTYKVLTTTKPSYLPHLITIQPPRNTCSSSLVTLACLPASSSLRITDRSFRCASPYLWNQLPPSLRQLHSTSVFYFCFPSSTSSVASPLSLSTTHSLFHSHLKPIFSTNHSHHRLFFFLQD